MKSYLIVLCFVLQLHPFCAQSFINGDFEINTSNGCDYNNTDVAFNTKMPNVHAFGKALSGNYHVGEMDIQTMGCYVTPQHGDWCLGLSSDTAETADAVSIELTSNLTIGKSYQVSFYVFGNTNFNNPVVDIKIGLSTNDSTFGSLLYVATPDTNTWKHVVFSFTASQSAKFITVEIAAGQTGWNQIDNFTISDVTGILENDPGSINIYPNPLISSTTIRTRQILSGACIEIYDSSGRRVKQIKDIFGQEIILQRDDLRSGFYLLYLIQGSKVIKDKLVIIN